MDVHKFRELVWQKGRGLYRDMPWRDEPTFYYVLVSEVMLQQTQVTRVLVKFTEFIEEFPTIEDLAAASLADVLRVWQGLGYNRRAKYLHEAAKQIVSQGQPANLDALTQLPGIGRNTAAAMMNYVYEVPTAYVETNIRTVMFHHFFANSTNVIDKEVLEMVDKTIEHESPREWFWALMDYGSDLKSKGYGRLDVSKHYKKQAPLKGSIREVRGKIIALLAQGRVSETTLLEQAGGDDRYSRAIEGLLADGLITRNEHGFDLTK